MNIYDFSVPMVGGGELSLAENKGKVMLIVNTATGCGFTPQYEDLEKLYEEYHEKGLEIIDIPCNQFAGQTFLKEQKGFSGFGHSPKGLAMAAMCLTRDVNYKKNPDIKWNFTKFLVDRDGNVVERFEPTADMGEVRKKVAELIHNEYRS